MTTEEVEFNEPSTEDEGLVEDWLSAINPNDRKFEEDVARNPYSIRHWLRYIDHKDTDDGKNEIFERALSLMPGSYKLWFIYLTKRIEQLTNISKLDSKYKQLNGVFERSLVFMHRMPRIWIEYINILIVQCEITKCRRTLDRCLQALPITQHNKIWPLYIQFVTTFPIPETAIRVYRRYLQFEPDNAEDYIDYLLTIDRYDEAAVKLAELVNNENYISKNGKSKHDLWTQMAEIMCKNPDKIRSLDVDSILREGITRYIDEQGKLWVSLAQYYIRLGLFEKARDIFEQGMNSVRTIRDFAHIFDFYTQSEERIIHMKANKTDLTPEEDLELDLQMLRYENVIERRPLLLNSVALRQNPHNVAEWLKRVELLKEKPIEVVRTFSNAVETVNPKKAVGKYPLFWIEFAKFYEKAGQIDDSRMIFEKATTMDYEKVDDLALVWCEWAEMELRADNPDGALKVMQRATALPSKKTSFYDQTESTQKRVHKSLKVWSMFADLEESFGTFESTKAVYDKIIDLKIVTPQILMNYGLFLEENKYYEDAFRAYEKGIALFRWPNVYDIWNTYLTKFLKRYQGNKLERARDLFEECLENCPEKYRKQFYLLYAKYEEEYGLARNSMDIYERAVERVGRHDKYEVFAIWITKAAELFGVTRTRQIYEKAIETLPDSKAIDMSMKYAEMERKMGEIDRARSIFAHGSQLADPRTNPEFWNTWKEFEIKHGNEDTLREMLRIKRSVMVVFNTSVNYMSAQMMANIANKQQNKMDQLKAMQEQDSKLQEDDEPVVGGDEDDDEDVDIPAVRPISGLLFVPSSDKPIQSSSESIIKPIPISNPDEINLGDDDDDDDDEEENQEPQAKKAKTIPA